MRLYFFIKLKYQAVTVILSVGNIYSVYVTYFLNCLTRKVAVYVILVNNVSTPSD